tara:strand:+ start:814 stop:2286 length:1473 start_codon:yes stop_codon:yes gene_type:complete
MTNLSSKLVSSSSYTVFVRGIDKISALVTVILLTRILEPTEFGIMAIAVIFVGIIEALSRVSLEESLIQKSETSNEEFNVSWTYGRILRSWIISILLFLFAPIIASFFGEERLEDILKALILVQLFNGFENIGMIKYTKAMDLKYPFYLSLYNKFSRLIVTLISAVILQNAWAFVYGYIAASLTSLILSYYYSSYRPSLNFNLKLLKSQFNFSGWIMVTYILNSFYSSIDRSFVGKMLNIATLGYYQIAVRFGNEFPGEIKSVSNLVLFPFYSFNKEKIDETRSNFLLITKLITFFSSCLLSFMYLSSDYLVILFLGNNWVEIISPMKILIIASLFQIINSQSFPLFKGLGIPKYELIITSVFIFSIFIGIYPLIIIYGLDGAALSVMMGHIVVMPLMLYFLIKNTGIRLSQLFRTFTYSIFSGILMASSINFLLFINDYSISWSILLQILTCAISVTALIYYFLTKILKDPDFLRAHRIFKREIYQRYF